MSDEDLLAAERARVSAPDAARDAAQAAVRANLGALLASPPVMTPVPPRTALPRLFSRVQVAAVGGALFGLGVAVGAVSTREDHAVAPPAPTLSLAPAGEAPPSAPKIAEAPPPPVALSAPAPAPSPRSVPRPAVSVSTEDAYIDAAREALARGLPADALAATDEHARRYPSGALTEEREALAIQALAALGRRREAGNRAGQFRKRWPDSLLMHAVNRSLE